MANENKKEQKNILATKWLFTKNKSCSCTMPGVWRAVSFCDGCAVIFHSPLGCAHVATLMDLGAQYRIIGDHQNETMDAVPLISSNLQEKEKDSIFGGVEKLRGCIAHVMKTWQPKCLLIATSCVAGVIGDDVIQPQPKVPGRVLLFGDQMGPCGQYAREVKRLLAYFDLDVKWQFPGYVPFAEWSELSTASLLIPLNYAGQTQGGLEKTAAAWAERFGTPSIRDVYPVGWQNTCAWLRKIAEFVKDEAKGEAVICQEEERLKDYIKSILPVTQNKKAVLGIGRGPRWYNPAETLNTMRRMQMEISAVILYDKLTDEEKDTVIDAVEDWKKTAQLPDVPLIADGNYTDCLKQADVLLTTDELPGNPVKQFFIPMVPLAGTDGEFIVMRTIYRLLCRYGNKGGIAYA